MGDATQGLLVTGILGSAATLAAERPVIREERRLAEQQLGFNQRIADLQARDVEIRGRKAIEEHSRTIARVSGAQRAALAAQGIDVSSGTALEIQQETAALGAEDLSQIRANIFRDAWGLKAAAAGLATQAGQVRIAARQTEREAIVSATRRTIRAGLKFKQEREA